MSEDEEEETLELKPMVANVEVSQNYTSLSVFEEGREKM